jgi:hypothetical protein
VSDGGRCVSRRGIVARAVSVCSAVADETRPKQSTAVPSIMGFDAELSKLSPVPQKL